MIKTDVENVVGVAKAFKEYIRLCKMGSDITDYEKLCESYPELKKKPISEVIGASQQSIEANKNFVKWKGLGNLFDAASGIGLASSVVALGATMGFIDINNPAVMDVVNEAAVIASTSVTLGAKLVATFAKSRLHEISSKTKRPYEEKICKDLDQYFKQLRLGNRAYSDLSKQRSAYYNSLSALEWNMGTNISLLELSKSNSMHKFYGFLRNMSLWVYRNVGKGFEALLTEKESSLYNTLIQKPAYFLIPNKVKRFFFGADEKENILRRIETYHKKGRDMPQYKELLKESPDGDIEAIVDDVNLALVKTYENTLASTIKISFASLQLHIYNAQLDYGSPTEFGKKERKQFIKILEPLSKLHLITQDQKYGHISKWSAETLGAIKNGNKISVPEFFSANLDHMKKVKYLLRDIDEKQNEFDPRFRMPETKTLILEFRLILDQIAKNRSTRNKAEEQLRIKINNLTHDTKKKKFEARKRRKEGNPGANDGGAHDNKRKNGLS